MARNQNDLRSWLRGLPVFPDATPTFDTDNLPSEPASLFLEWLEDAAAAGQLAAHAMCLSTSSRNSVPSARNLILKDLDDRGWQFATHRTSPKGLDLRDNPLATLTFFWPVTARQVRVAGVVNELPPEESAHDFLARPISSRVATLVGRQSEPLSARDDYANAVATALSQVDAQPGIVDEAWTLYALAPTRVEFWQASADREHARVLYEKGGGGWKANLLWP